MTRDEYRHVVSSAPQGAYPAWLYASFAEVMLDRAVTVDEFKAAHAAYGAQREPPDTLETPRPADAWWRRRPVGTD